MIRFIGNQYSGKSMGGPYRARNFEVVQNRFRNPGAIIALPDIEIIRVVTFSPHNMVETDGSEDNIDVDGVVNSTFLAARHIAGVLNLRSRSFTFWHP